METILTEKLWNYIVNNNPELMFNLQESYSVMTYLKEKIEGIHGLIQRLNYQNLPMDLIEELCMDELTKELKPSRYNFIRNIFERQFTEKAQMLKEHGTLTYEIINILISCEGIFRQLGFAGEEEKDRMLRITVTDRIECHLKREKESV